MIVRDLSALSAGHRKKTDIIRLTVNLRSCDSPTKQLISTCYNYPLRRFRKPTRSTCIHSAETHPSKPLLVVNTYQTPLPHQ